MPRFPARHWLAACLTLFAFFTLFAAAPGRAAEEFLDPAIAFKFEARMADPQTAEVTYTIAPKYYMYRERFAFKSSNPAVKLGDRAFTAAGATITKDVPDGALAVARARQTNMEGWNDRRRAMHEKDKK